MSTYTKEAVNPETGKLQVALFIDNFYDKHEYGVAFRKDHKDSSIEDTFSPLRYYVYRISDVEPSQLKGEE